MEKRNVAGRLLRCGYTTGVCAAAAAKAATLMLLTGEPVDSVSVTTPKEVLLKLDVLNTEKRGQWIRSAVKKDGGDDPDVTNGMLLYASVKKTSQGVRIDGGEGVGRVTKPGLDQPVGAAAINSVPRKMIEASVKEICRACGYTEGISVLITIPDGAELAKRTFNPRMGIEGGLSVIGTTGIVEPMSNRALVETIRLELNQLRIRGADSVLLTPGNYGELFAQNALGLSLKEHVVCSNYIGDAVDAAVEMGFLRILLVGHIGKMVKLGIGVTNTHSAFGDGRMETLIACALAAGAQLPLLHQIAHCVTTDGALQLLYDAGALEATMDILGAKIDGCLRRRIPEQVEVGFVCFTNTRPFEGVLAQSKNAAELMRKWRQ